jgi:hypothetical protein
VSLCMPEFKSQWKLLLHQLRGWDWNPTTQISEWPQGEENSYLHQRTVCKNFTGTGDEVIFPWNYSTVKIVILQSD